MATPTYYSDITWTLASTDKLRTGVENDADTVEPLTPMMQYVLYDNPDGFAAYTAYASNGANLPTEQMTNNLEAYDSYSLQIVCDVTSSPVSGAGCCLMDASD